MVSYFRLVKNIFKLQISCLNFLFKSVYFFIALTINRKTGYEGGILNYVNNVAPKSRTKEVYATGLIGFLDF